MSNAHHDGPSYNPSPPVSPFVPSIIVPKKIHKQSKTLIHQHPVLIRKQKAIRDQAKTLDDLKSIYAFYGALDGLSSSFSMLKYFFDFYYTNSPLSSDVVLHDWSLTPEGMLFIAMESMALMLFAIAGNYCDGDIKSARTFAEAQIKLKNHPFLPWLTGLMAYLWPYFRDAMKAIKNGGKSIRNAISFAELLSFRYDLRSMIMPVTVVLSVLSACNRMWLRSIREQRKADKDENKGLLSETTLQLARVSGQLRSFEENNITDETQWTRLKTQINDEIHRNQNKIAQQLALQCSWWLSDLSAGFNGLMDTAYLLFGVLSVAVLVPGSFFFAYVAGFTLFSGVMCVITRIYEEHNFQRELRVQQLELDLTHHAMSLMVLFSELNAISWALATDDGTGSSPDVMAALLARQRQAMIALEGGLDLCLSSRNEIKHYSDLSLGFVLLGGFKNGIDAYGTVASVIFVIASVSTLLGVAFSPLLLVGCVSWGIMSVLSCVAYSLIDYAYYLSDRSEPSSTSSLPAIVGMIKEQFQNNVTNIESETVTNVLKELTVDSPPQVFFLEWFEVIRLFCSGGGKGIRAVDSILPALQNMGKDGHYHDNPTMIFFACLDALLFAFVFALRGFARLSRVKIEEDEGTILNDPHHHADNHSSDDESCEGSFDSTPSPRSPSPAFFRPVPSMPLSSFSSVSRVLTTSLSI
jgi:hypothetical protein